MKKKEILAVMATASMIGVSACGAKELTLSTDHIEVELGSSPAADAANYVEDADVAAEAAVDFSVVNVMKTGMYRAVVTYKDQTAEFEVAVVDTTAPEVTVAEEVVVAAGEPLYAKDIITGVTELSGKVEVAFQTPEETAPAPKETEAAGTTDTTENGDNTETVDEAEREKGTESTETAESTEASVETSMPAQETEFILGDVLCSNAYVVYPETGEYDNTLTVTDESGNSTEVTVHVTVGSAPEIRGVKDITVTAGTEEETVNYLDGVTAEDSSGNDITEDIVCDSSAADLTAEGEYTVVYTVTDKDGFTATESAVVTVEEKSAKKPDEKKSGTSGKDSGSGNTNSNTSKTSGNGGNASGNGGNSENTGASGNNTSGGSTSGNNGNAGGSNGGGSTSGNDGSTSGDTGNAGNTNGTSGGNTSSDSGNGGNTGNAPADTGNTGNGGNMNTPSADNGGNTSTPGTDTGNTGTPDAGNTNTGSNGGEMSVPDDAIELPDWMLDNSQADPGNNGHGGGGGNSDIIFN